MIGAFEPSTHIPLDRRAVPRFAYDGETRVMGADWTVDALVKDIGTGGVCLVFGESTSIVVGERVQLEFRLPTLPTPTRIAAVARWIGGPDRVMAGFQFIDGLRAQEAWAINALGAMTD